MGRYLRIARVAKVRRNKGRLVVRSVDGLPFLLYEGLSVWIVPPSAEAPRHVTLSMADDQGDEAVVTFEGVADPKQLSAYQGRYLLAFRADLDQELLRESGWSVKGFALDDVTLGRVGHITQVEQMPGQVMLTVQGSFGEALVPLAADLVVDVDEQGEVLTMDLPHGLIPAPETASAAAEPTEVGVVSVRADSAFSPDKADDIAFASSDVSRE